MTERIATERITLDVSKPDVQQTVAITRGDTARRWEIKLVNRGSAIDVGRRWTAAIYGIKPDEKEIFNGCIVEGDRIIYDFSSGTEISTSAGAFEVSLMVYDEEGDLLHAPKIWVNVLDAPYREKASNNQYTAAQEIIRRLNKNEGDLEELEDVVYKGGPYATTVTRVIITPEAWIKDENEKVYARITLPNNDNNAVTYMIPEDEETRRLATKAELSVQKDDSSADSNAVVIEGGSLTEIPEENMSFLSFTMRAASTNTMILAEEDEPSQYDHVVSFVGVSAGGGAATFVGETQPPEGSSYTLWVDTSKSPGTVKYKDEDGVWTAASGGGGAGGSNLKLTNLSGWLSKSVATGASCPIKLQWSSIEDEAPTGNGILTVKVNGVTKTTREVAQGEVTEDIGKYLAKGINTVTVTVTDAYGSYKNLTLTITSVSVSISSYFDDSRPYTGEITFAYIPVGAVSKTVYFLVDGEEAGTQIVTESGNEQSYDIPAQSHGSHTLEVYFMADIDGESVPSNHLYYDLICTEEGDNTPIITTSFRQASVKQYGTAVIPYIAYTPNSLTSAVQLKDGDQVKELTVDRTRQTWSYKATESGTKNLEIVCGETVKHISFEVVKSDISVQAESKNLQLYLTSQGRANTEANPLDWSYGNVKAEMTGFNLKSDGWQPDADGNTVLRVAGDARVNIPFNVFGTDFRDMGKTIEIEFSTRDVMNYDAVVLSSWSGERGIKITAQKAELRSQNSHIFTQYKEDEHVRITFSVEKRSENRLLTIYINGIMSGAVQYGENDDFSQADPVGISIGSNDCTVDIYCIRVYGNKLNRSQILKNWIADTQDVDAMIERYVRNDIFDDYGNIAISKLPQTLPYLVVNAESYDWLPKKKGDVKIVGGRYEDPDHPERSFTFEDAEIDVQGTSSETYPRKNYKMKFKGGFTIEGKHQDAYQLRPTSMPTDVFTFKADVASSEGANNVELVRFYEDNCPVKTPPQEEDSRVRQGIEGYPCLMFYYDGQNYNFIGKYNFNNDKATEEVFGFEEGDESWEIRQNNTDMVIWKDDNFEGDAWKASFEARYPDKSEDVTNLQALSTWLKSTDTTAVDTEEEKAARLQKFKDEFENWFNKDAMIFNYIFTELFLLMDNRAKNAFPTRYDEDGKWLILPYDYDSAIGINNMGELKYGYHLEDIDYVGDAPVFNGQDSVLFVNIRLAFAEEIKTMYQNLRKNELFSYEEIERRFEEHQGVWGEAIFNEDARFKYIEPLTQNNDGAYLPMLQGSKSEQRKWWLYNRFRYMDSKYGAGDSTLDFIKIRTNAVADITVTPYADIYASAKFDSIVVTERALRGKDENGNDLTYTLVNPQSAGKETDLLIYSASQLASVGDLSGLKASTFDFSKAIRLSSLKIGSAASGYTNPNLTNLSIGNLTLLKEIDLRNCSALTQAVDLSGCANIERVYCEGSAITGVNLPDGGILKTLHLPATVTSLDIRNHKQLTDFSLASSANLTTLRLEGMAGTAVNSLAIIKAMPNNSRVRLIGFDWSAKNMTDIYGAFEKLFTCRGQDENGINVQNAVVSGTVSVDRISAEQLAGIRERYSESDVVVNYKKMVNYVRFVSDGVVISDQLLDKNEAIVVPEEPFKPSTEQVMYSFLGWSLDGVTVAEVPSVMGDESLNFTALFEEEPKAITRALLKRNIREYSSRLEQIVIYSAFEDCNKLISVSIPFATRLSDYAFKNCEKLTDVDLPRVTEISSSVFSGCKSLENLNLPKLETTNSSNSLIGMTGLKTASFESMPRVPQGLSGNTTLISIYIPKAKTISSLSGCTALKSIDLPNATKIESKAFSGCTSLKEVRLPGEPPTLASTDAFDRISGSCIFYIPAGSLTDYQSATNWSAIVNDFTFKEV